LLTFFLLPLPNTTTTTTTADYKVPRYFRNDLFGLISEARRPPYRWFLVGPERSSTTVHIDPLATAAWHTLIVGKKHWVLFPPHVPKHIAKGKHFVLKGEDDEAIHYFTTILPRIKEKAQQIGNRGMFKDFACYDFTQEAGETVFIPNGWWYVTIMHNDVYMQCNA
jgi:histone arginine demethylase JMJD6